MHTRLSSDPSSPRSPLPPPTKRVSVVLRSAHPSPPVSSGRCASASSSVWPPRGSRRHLPRDNLHSIGRRAGRSIWASTGEQTFPLHVGFGCWERPCLEERLYGALQRIRARASGLARPPARHSSCWGRRGTDWCGWRLSGAQCLRLITSMRAGHGSSSRDSIFTLPRKPPLPLPRI